MTRAVVVRRAHILDAAAIARIHVEGWRAAYSGLIDQSVLDNLDVVSREREWASRLSYAGAPLGSGTPTRVHTTLVAERDGEVIAWCSYGGPQEAGEARGNVSALYADPSAWGTGAGHALMLAVEEALRAEGYDAAYLWVLDGNDRAIAFYEHHGWGDDGAVKIESLRGAEGLRERRFVRTL